MSATRNPQLEPYRKKRNPDRTPEPFGAAASAAGAAPRFVVQKHWARNLHYDLRLELDGVLKSWAVPRGPSTKVEEKRLAVHVEDHPLEYADFEGVIPDGNYGAGSVIVWDRGTFGSFKPEDLLEQYERGKMELELNGYKLRGRWTLVRMGRKDKEWLLLKKADASATDREAIDRYPESVITGLTVEQMKDVQGTLETIEDHVVSMGAPRRAVAPKDVPFMLATLAETPPSGPDWAFEIKYDGVRVMAGRDGDTVTMLGRSGEDITARYPEVTAALKSLAVPRFLFDGEIIAEDEHGRPSFQRLQARMALKKPRDIQAAMARVPARGVFFDCLAAFGHDLRKLPLEQRKDVLSQILPPLGPAQRVDHVLEHGQAFFEAASELKLEGIVGKKLNSTYTGRRSGEWIKVKCQARQEFVIGGWTEPQGSRAGFGALHVGVYDGERLVYVTKVGTGFDDALITDLMAKLAPLARDATPFVEGPTGRGHHWVEPRLVAEVRFTEWTRDGGLRHPTFLGLRTDRKPEEVRREEPESQTLPAEEPASPTAKAAATRGARKAKADVAKPAEKPKPVVPEASAILVTNPKKVFWPADGYTKSDLVGYYEAIAPLMLRYLRDRPAVLTRYPDGIEGKSFFQKDAPVFVPDWVRTEPIYSHDTDRHIRYFVIDDVATLKYIANLGTIPIHAWSARVSTLDMPDWLVLDLDPKGAPFTDVVQVAQTLHEILDELGLPSYPKTSGASGLHVLIPMGRRYTHEETRTFARVLATLTVEAVPAISTIARAIQSRGGKVYVDFGQNGQGNTIVAPFSVRPLTAAPASCPLLWKEVNAKLDPTRFTIKTIPKRFEKLDDPLAPVMGDGIDMAAAIARIERRSNAKASAKDKDKG